MQSRNRCIAGLLRSGDVSIVDGDEHVYVVHFTEAARENSIATSYRGDVFACATDDRVLTSPGLIEEVDWEPGRMMVAPVFAMPPGSCLHAFAYNGRWYLSTNRTLDAFSARWGSRTDPSFGELFMRAVSGADENASWQSWAPAALAPMGDGATFNFWLVHDEWVSPNLEVYLMPVARTTSAEYEQMRAPVGVRKFTLTPPDTARTTAPAWGYLVHDGWRWVRHTSPAYRRQMELVANEPNRRKRYLQLMGTSPVVLAEYLSTRPSVADMKLEDDAAWPTVKQILEDPEFRHDATADQPRRTQDWLNRTAVDWQTRRNSPVFCAGLRAAVLEWYHREKSRLDIDRWPT